MAGHTTARDAAAAVSKGAAAPVYLLVGDDETAKDALVTAFEALVEPGLQPFNVERFYANDRGVEPAAVAAAASTMPFMAPRRVVVVLRAEHWLRARGKVDRTETDDEDADEARQADGDDGSDGGDPAALEAYLDNPSPQSVVVFVAADVNRSLRLTKALLKVAEVIEYWGLKGEKGARVQAGAALDQGRRLVVALLREAGLAIDSDALQAVIEHGGTDVGELRNTVDHLVAFCADHSRVTRADVEAIVQGEALTDEWGLTGAIDRRDVVGALGQLRLQLDEGRAPHQVFGMIAWWVRERLPQRTAASLPEAVEALLTANMALNSSADSRMALEQLVMTLCGVGKRR